MSDNWFYEYFINEAKSVIRPCSGGGSVPKPLTYDYMPEGYPSKSVQTVTLMEEQEVAFSVMEGIYAAVSPVPFELTEGETYTVVWDGVEYKCVCHTAANGDPYIGNLAALELKPTGEPFLYALVEPGYMWVSYDTATTHTIGVTTSPETITPMSYDYMPEGYPKKSGLSMEWDGNTEGLVSVLEMFYKVSDLLPSDAELIGSTVELSNGDKGEITSAYIHAVSEDITYVGDGDIFIAVVKKDNAIFEDTTFPQKGTYFAKQQNIKAQHAKPLYVQKLTGHITQMAEEFMPPRIVEAIDSIGTVAHNALSTANNAQTTANAAKTTANNAQTTANAAKTTANNAQTTANAAKTTATNTQTTADAAKTAANTAKETANAAKTAAANAQSTANAAKTAAENAQTTATNAQSTADAAKTAASNAQTTANTAKETANAAKTAAENTVKYAASQNLTDAQKEQARTNIGAGTSSFSGSWNDLTDKPFKPANKSYLTFSSPNSFTLSVNNATKHWDGTLEYFASDRAWTTWGGTNALSAVYDDGEYVLYLRGTGNTVIAGWHTKHWSFTGSNIACIGNIETLLDYAMVESGEHPTMASDCYSNMFQGCTGLTQAPALPATTLASDCYSNMFQGCTGLTQAPALPATTLVSNCYRGMFAGCTSLTQAPALPATTLATSCYSGMFQDCTGLTQAPALPSTTLANYCYSSMFRGCTGLTQAPALPSTTLATYCYSGMFAGCTGLTQAPALPATTLASYCYSNMFQGCTGLTQAPALPMTTLTKYCYSGMFEDCTGLTQVPALPATTLAECCYYYMFKGCTSLKLSSTKTDEYTQEYRIPSSGDGTTASAALVSMFESTGGAFTRDPSINTTYYLSTDNMIVRETDGATLNGYVGSMINNAISEHADTAEYIIHSSTSGSTKKFKITVDDTGAISATEVT